MSREWGEREVCLDFRNSADRMPRQGTAAVSNRISEETYRTVGWSVKRGWRFEQAGSFSLRPAEQCLDLVGAREEGWEERVGQEQRLRRTITRQPLGRSRLPASLFISVSRSQDEHTLGHLISHVSLSPTEPARSDPVHPSPPFPLLFFLDPMLMRRLGRVSFVWWPSPQLSGQAGSSSR